MSNLHVKNWYRRRDIAFDSHPQFVATKSKLVILMLVDHQNLVA